MTNALATFEPNFDMLGGGGGSDTPPFIRFRQGQQFCKPLTGGEDVDITGSLFVGAMATFRATKVAWTDESNTPVEEHSAYITLGQRLPAQLTNYPKRADGRDAWTDGFQLDGLVYISGDWHQATVSTQTVTSNIQFRTAVQNAHKTAGRIYSLRDWAPIWEFGKPDLLKTSVGGNIKIPSYVFRGFVDATGEVGAAVGDASELEGAVASLVGRVPTDPNTQAPFLLPEPEQPKLGTNTEAMLASGVAVPQKPAGGSVTNELNDDIPF